MNLFIISRVLLVKCTVAVAVREFRIRSNRGYTVCAPVVPLVSLVPRHLSVNIDVNYTLCAPVVPLVSFVSIDDNIDVNLLMISVNFA